MSESRVNEGVNSLDHAPGEIRYTIHQGRCCLAFEGCEFQPTDSVDAWNERAWLFVSDEAREQLSALLDVPKNTLQFAGWFEVTFLGSIDDAPGEGHMGMWNRAAFIDKVLAARLEVPPFSNTRGTGGIRGLVARRRRENAASS